MSASYWNTPERLALLERTCGLPPWLIASHGTDWCASLLACVIDALIRDHAVQWLGERGVNVGRPLGSWTFASAQAADGYPHIAEPYTSRNAAIEAALRWVAEQKEKP